MLRTFLRCRSAGLAGASSSLASLSSALLPLPPARAAWQQTARSGLLATRPACREAGRLIEHNWAGKALRWGRSAEPAGADRPSFVER